MESDYNNGAYSKVREFAIKSAGFANPWQARHREGLGVGCGGGSGTGGGRRVERAQRV